MTKPEVERLLALARKAELTGPDAAKWVDRLAPERQKLVEAARFLVQSGEQEEATELAANVWRLWLVVGDNTGGREFLGLVLDADRAKPSRERALALYADGLLAFRAGAQTESRVRNQAALVTARAVGDREAESLALVGLSRLAFREGDNARVRALASEARNLTSGLDARAGVMPLHMLAAGTRLDGDYDDAIELYNESLAVVRDLGDSRMVGMELHNMGHVELHRGNVDAAARCFTEAAEIRDRDDLYETAMTHLNQAALAFAQGDGHNAATLLQRMQSALDSAAIVLDPDDAFEVGWLRSNLS